jgi:hypothetical protein
MKKLLAIVLLCAAPAGAAPRWLTAVPRAVGRTYGNMVTFRHPALALEQWASIGAVAFDEKTTVDVFSRCLTCAESSLFYQGRRYGTGIALAGTVLFGTFYATGEQYGSELLRDDPSRIWRALPNAQVAVPLAIHIPAGIDNMRIKGTN